MTPHWNDAPEWAQWLAQNEDGNWYWYEFEPGAIPFGFWLDAGYGQELWARKTPCYREWDQTLEARP